MTALQKTAIQNAVIGGIVTLVGTLILMVLTGAWTAKESATDHRADIQAVRADLRRVLDVVCLDKPQAPQCGNGATP